jgi:hypothetical protein
VLTSDLTRRLFRTPEQFHEYFGSEAQATGRLLQRQLLLVSTGPRSSTGYALRILGVTERGDRITVKVASARRTSPTTSKRA